MQIRQFQAENLHGYLDFDIPFYQDLTFLTGINGSGKTSVVNAIVSLISPSLRNLANISYDNMKLIINIEGKNITIETKCTDEIIRIKTSENEQELSFSPFTIDPEEGWRGEEHEVEYYEALESSEAQHPVLQFIRNLPTPMFLNLDRRATGIGPEIRRRRIYQRRPVRRPRNVFGVSLVQSLSQAASLAEDAYSQFIIGQSRLGQSLRRTAVLDAITISPRAMSSQFELSAPNDDDLKSIEALKAAIPEISNILDLPHELVAERFDPFIKNLEKITKTISVSDSADAILDADDQVKMSALINWAQIKPLFDRTLILNENLQNYKTENEKLERPISEYLFLVNRFLEHSAKKIAFDDTGNLVVQFADRESRPIVSLSSGEAQIVVIVTHLAFNPAAQKANVFIIDEPELSLHVEWQEMFVDTLRAANPNVQLILATHSPSIIVDYFKKCRDLSPGPVRQSRRSPNVGRGDKLA